MGSKYVTYLKLDQNFQDLYQRCCALTGFNSDFPGHITLLASKEEPKDLIKTVNKFSENLENIFIRYHSLGTFLTDNKVLYLAPSKSPTLMNIQSIIYNVYKDILIDQDSGYFSPQYWMPHSTIAWPCKDGDIFNITNILENTLEDQKFRVTAIEIARTNPFEVIQSIPLTRP